MRPGGGPLALVCALATLTPLAAAQVVSKTVGLAHFSADLSQAFPGGMIVAHLASRGRLGTVYAILDGRRALIYDAPHGARAFVPVPLDTEAGPDVLGFELIARSGRQRIPLDIEVAPREYAARSVTIPETRRALLKAPRVVIEAREMRLLLRSESAVALWQGPFKPPVAAPPVASFGMPEARLDGAPVEALLDGAFGERHRGLDYEAAAGVIVQAPAAGVVLFAGNRTLTGGTVVLDHGQGVVSLLAHLARVDLREGDHVEGRAPIGLVGDTGIAYAAHLHWGLYVHGIAVDPRIFLSLAE